MRKIKRKVDKKEKSLKLAAIVDENREQILKDAERIFEKSDEFQIFKSLVENPGNISDDVVLELALILGEIYKISQMKDKNEKVRAESTLRIKATKYIKDLAPYLRSNINSHVFVVLLMLNEILVDYTSCKNRFEEELRNKGLKVDYEVTKDLFRAEGCLVKPIAEVLGYEPVFVGELKDKIQDTINWLSKTLIRMIKYNSKTILWDNLFTVTENSLEDLYKKIDSKFEFTEKVEEIFPDEKDLFKEMVTKLKYAKDNLEGVILEHKQILPIGYKKDITHLKSTLTRVENLFNIFYNLLNIGETTGEYKLSFL